MAKVAGPRDSAFDPGRLAQPLCPGSERAATGDPGVVAGPPRLRGEAAGHFPCHSLRIHRTSSSSSRSGSRPASNAGMTFFLP